MSRADVHLVAFVAHDGTREAEAVRAGDDMGGWCVHLYRQRDEKPRLYLSTSRWPTRALAEKRARAWVEGGESDT